MKSFSALCIFAVVCSALGAPEPVDQELVENSTRDMDLLMNSRKLVEQLVGNLRKSAEEALHAVSEFETGVKNQTKLALNKIVDDVGKFKNRVEETVEKVFHRISNSSVAVKECVDSHRVAATAVFNETLSGTMSCVNERISGITALIRQLTILANDGLQDAARALGDMKQCTQEHSGNLFAAGSCLGSVALQTELKAVSFIAHSGILIGRINIDIIGMPTAMEVCAGSRLVQTGLATGKIVIDIGTCSASGIYNTILGKPSIHVE